MIWIILYIICTAICCGIMLYIKDIDVNDPDIILASIGGLVWPVVLVFSIICVLGHCVRLLLTKIIKTK